MSVVVQLEDVIDTADAELTHPVALVPIAEMTRRICSWAALLPSGALLSLLFIVKE
ncbi:MAG: hypothetical protein HC851_08315 [Acaryochloris sp. RU_4_1]|nr:hypothetical protein [Acaryochloris sp. RU_4_1]